MEIAFDGAAREGECWHMSDAFGEESLIKFWPDSSSIDMRIGGGGLQTTTAFVTFPCTIIAAAEVDCAEQQT